MGESRERAPARSEHREEVAAELGAWFEDHEVLQKEEHPLRQTWHVPVVKPLRNAAGRRARLFRQEPPTAKAHFAASMSSMSFRSRSFTKVLSDVPRASARAAR